MKVMARGVRTMAIDLTETQIRATEIPIGVIVVAAGAGTGKTTVLSETVAGKMVAGQRVDIRDLLVLTFTRKAASEMSERIAVRLKELASETDDKFERDWLNEAASHVPDAAIETLDAFAQRLLRDHPNESGIDPNFQVIEPDRERELGEKVARDCFERWLDSPPHKLWSDLAKGINAQDWPQIFYALDSCLMTRQAVDIPSLLVGRDTGDVSDINGLLEKLRRAADEKYRETLDHLLNEMSGFDELLRETIKIGEESKAAFADKAKTVLGDLPAVEKWMENDPLDWNDPILKAIAGWKLFGTKKGTQGEANEIVRLLRSHLTSKEDKAFEQSELLISIDLERRLVGPREALAYALVDFHNAFLDARRSFNVLSFADCEIDALRLLKSDSEIRDHYHRKYQYVIVDEYQDINPLQQELIFTLSRESTDEHNLPANLYVVGDERQSIYGFRNADFTLLRDLRGKLKEIDREGAGNRILHENFRSRPELLDFANRIFTEIWGVENDIEHTDLKASHIPYLNESKSDEPRIELNLIIADDTDTGRRREAVVIARRVSEIVRDLKIPVSDTDRDGNPVLRPIKWGDCAVLMRKKSVFALYEEAFSQLGIPYVTESGGGFWDTPEVADIVSLLCCLSQAPENLDWAVLLRSPWVGISDSGLLEIADRSSGRDWSGAIDEIEFRDETDNRRIANFRSWFVPLMNSAGRVPVHQLVDKALVLSGYLQSVFALERGRNLRANIEKLLDILRSDAGLFNPLSAVEYIRWLRAKDVEEFQASVAPSGSDGAVTLVTVHKAKGREWPLVILANLSVKPGGGRSSEILWDKNHGLAFKWLNPSTGNSDTPAGYHTVRDLHKAAEDSEEQRVLYVALTRPREYLILSGSIKEKEIKGKGKKENKLKWGYESSSWLAQLNNTVAIEGGSLLGTPLDKDTGAQDLNCMTTSQQANEKIAPVIVRRIFHGETRPLSNIQTETEPDPELVKRLRNKLDSITALPDPTANRYLVTVTEIASFEKCPRMYAYRTLWNVPRCMGIEKFLPQISSFEQSDEEDAPDHDIDHAETFELPASEWGTLAHKLMELIPFDATSDMIREKAVSLLEGSGLDAEKYADKLTRMISETLKLPIFDLLKKCTAKREFRLMGRIAETDEVILGTIDLHAECDDRLIVIDYKSGAVDPDRAESHSKYYSLQLALYAHLASGRRMIPAESVEAHIIYLDPGLDVPVPVTDSTLKNAIDAVHALSTASSKNDFPATPDEKICAWCDYRDICPSSYSL